MASGVRRPGAWKRARRDVTSRLASGAIGLFLRCPEGAVRALGRGWGRWGPFAARGTRRLAREHLDLALGAELSAVERERIVRGTFAHFGRMAGDLFAMARRGPEALAVEPESAKRLASLLEEGRRRGRGVVAVSAHLGNWELVAAHAARTFPCAVVARRMKDPRLDRRMVRMREGWGLRTFYQDDSPRKVLEWLKGNGVLGLVVDQDVRRLNGVFVPFFGRPAYTPSAPASLSIRTGAPILAVVAVRDGEAYRFRTSDALLEPAATGDRHKDVEEYTGRWNRWIERFIRDYPEQWAWWHRRWRTRPDMM